MWDMTGNGGKPEIKVYKSYSATSVPGKGGSSHNATGFQVDGFAQVHNGDRNYFTIMTAELSRSL